MFYAEYDEVYGGWCVFHTDSEKAFATYGSNEEAELDALDRNKMNRSDLK